MTRKALLIALALATLAVCSCLKEQAQGQLPEGYGGINLRLDSGSALRLETKTDAEDLADGLRFNNVLVILENSSHKVAGIVYKTYPYVPGVDDLQDAWLMQGRQRNQGAHFRKHLRSDGNGFVIKHAAMQHSVTDCAQMMRGKETFNPFNQER